MEINRHDLAAEIITAVLYSWHIQNAPKIAKTILQVALNPQTLNLCNTTAIGIIDRAQVTRSWTDAIDATIDCDRSLVMALAN